MVNMIGGTLYDHIMIVNLHFVSEQDIYMSSKKYEESNHNLDLDYLTISY